MLQKWTLRLGFAKIGGELLGLPLFVLSSPAVFDLDRWWDEIGGGGHVLDALLGEPTLSNHFLADPTLATPPR